MALVSIRQQIKNNLVTILTGLTVNSKNIAVFLNDIYSLTSSDFPSIIINTINESISTETIGYPETQQRVLSLEITGIYQTSINLDSIIDDFCTIVEMKLCQTELIKKINSLNSIILKSNIESIEFKEFSEIAENTSGFTINLNVTYICEENNLRVDI
jgi:hypothetical protein